MFKTFLQLCILYWWKREPYVNIPFYLFSVPRTELHFELLLLNSDHIETVLPSDFTLRSSSSKLWGWRLTERSSNPSQVRVPTVRTAETITTPTSRKRPTSTVSPLGSESPKHKVLIGISFSHRKKKYIHIARPASAVLQVSPVQQMPPNGQHRTVNCSAPLIVLQINKLGR